MSGLVYSRFNLGLNHIYKRMNCHLQLPWYKCELRNGVCKLRMGERQESETRQLILT